MHWSSVRISNTADDNQQCLQSAVGDWTTAVSKKNRKNMSKKKEAAVEPLLDLKISKEVVEEVKEQIIEKVVESPPYHNVLS